MSLEVQVTFDCADPGAQALFWCEVLGYELQPPPPGFDSWDAALDAWGVPPERRNDRSAALDPDGKGPRLFFQKVPEGKTAKNRVHLDVRAAPGLSGDERMAALEAKAEALVALGAERVKRFEPDPAQQEAGFITMRDPEGNEFDLDCVGGAVVRTRGSAAIRMAGLVLAVAALTGLSACSGDDAPGESADPSPSAVFDQALHDELVQLQADDQAEMTGQGPDSTTTADERQARLAEILDHHGWPGWDLVGEKGSSAAWLIAQHADLDPELQVRALDLLEEAVAAGNASPGDLAYLTDRVAVARGEDQTYGTQIRCQGSEPVPATPIADEAAVEQRREGAGLPTLKSYLAEMRRLCSDADG